MKKIFEKKDSCGGFIEVQLLDHNNKVPEDLIWLHVKSVDDGENGIVMTKEEALLIASGLKKAVKDLSIKQE